METTVWDLSRIYPSEEAFEEDLALLKKKSAEMGGYKGLLKEESKLKQYLSLEREVNDLLEHLYMFAGMRSDRDKKNVAFTEAESKVILALQDLNSKTSFESPELIALGKEHLDCFLQRNPEFNDFSFIFEKLFQGQKYILSQQEEKLLSCFSPILGEGGELYSKLSVGDYCPQEAKLSDGRLVLVSSANWTDLIGKEKKAEDRQAIFEALYHQFDSHKNTYGEIYNLTVQSQLAEMKARGYSSILQEHLSQNAIPESVFLNLVDVASTHAEPLHKYYRIRNIIAPMTASFRLPNRRRNTPTSRPRSCSSPRFPPSRRISGTRPTKSSKTATSMFTQRKANAAGPIATAGPTSTPTSF